MAHVKKHQVVEEKLLFHICKLLHPQLRISERFHVFEGWKSPNNINENVKEFELSVKYYAYKTKKMCSNQYVKKLHNFFGNDFFVFTDQTQMNKICQFKSLFYSTLRLIKTVLQSITHYLLLIKL